MALGTAASGPGGHFLRLINSGDFNKYKYNQKTRSIHVFTFRETQNPDRLDTFDFDKLTLKIITSARKHQTKETKKKLLTVTVILRLFEILRSTTRTSASKFEKMAKMRFFVSFDRIFTKLQH
jgi:hypothetical protein